MDQEFDLRPYVLAVFRRWYLILIIPLIVALAVASILFFRPQSHTAQADVLITSISPQITLDQRYADRDATLITNSTFQRQALIRLATSGTVEQLAADRLGIELTSPGMLLSRITIDTTSDLLQITASGGDIASARSLAEAWGQSYEAVVADVYRGNRTSPTTLADDILAAEERYSTAQLALEAFLANPETTTIEQQVLRIEGLLNNSLTAQQNLFSQYLTRTQELILVLQDARSVREQILGSDGENPSDRIVILALRARAISSTNLPVQLNLGTLADDGQSSLADLDNLIAALEEQISLLQEITQEFSNNLALGDGAGVGLSGAERERYEADLATLRKQREELVSQQRLLEQQRDIAFTSLEVLQSRVEEQTISESTPQFSVRFLSSTNLPEESLQLRILLFAVGTFIVTAFLVIVVILLRDMIIPQVRASLAATAPKA